MTNKKTYPELVELISKLQFESRYDDAKICVKALYDLERKDKRISELEAQNERWGKAGLQCQAEWNMAQVRIDELEHQLKVECDTYLWNRKRMSRRIALLEYWMERLFKYGSSPEARRNELTMATEIPDLLMREGEDILHHLEERSDLEKGE